MDHPVITSTRGHLTQQSYRSTGIRTGSRAAVGGGGVRSLPKVNTEIYGQIDRILCLYLLKH